jgi:hypothetical protein
MVKRCLWKAHGALEDRSLSMPQAVELQLILVELQAH